MSDRHRSAWLVLSDVERYRGHRADAGGVESDAAAFAGRADDGQSRAQCTPQDDPASVEEE